MKSRRIFVSTVLIATAGLLLAFACGAKYDAVQNAVASPPPF